MAITGTGSLGDSIQAELITQEFYLAVRKSYVYSQPPITYSPPGAIVAQGNHYSSMAIVSYFPLQPVTAAAPELADVVPVALADRVVSVSPNLYINAVQESLKVRLQSTPDVAKVAAAEIANNAGESVDYLARTVAVSGNALIFGGTASSRDAVTTASQIDHADFLNAAAYLAGAEKIPGWGAGIGEGIGGIFRTATIADVIEDANIILVGEYGGKPEIILNGEIGMHMAGVRMVQSEFAKIFHGGGTSAGAVASSLVSAVTPGATALALASSMSSGAIGLYYCLGTPESSANGEQVPVETIMQASSNTTAVTIVGAGPNGGTLYAYSSGASVTHSHQVYATVFFGARSIIKVYTTEEGMGPEPQLLPPEDTGRAKQFRDWVWRHYVGYGRRAENGLFRIEHGCARFTLGA